MAFGYCGKRVRLVPYDFDRHFENFYEWINDSDVTFTLGHRGTPVTRESQRETFQKFTTSEDTVFFAIELLDGTHIGGSTIDHITLANGFGNTGSYIANLEHRGKGLGTEAAILRARYAFDILGLRMVTSSYLAHNPASKRMQEKVGYLEWGCLPNQHWKEGEFRDMHYTYLTRERFFELHG
jgi:RimJ/RimL family protein N-acetyltransferase